MNLKQLAEYRKEFGAIPADELLAIAEGNDCEKYSAEEIRAIHRILVEKGKRPPRVPALSREDAETNGENGGTSYHRDAAEAHGGRTWGYQTQPRKRHHFRRYDDVRWYRRSGNNLVFMLIHLLTAGLVPAMLWVVLNFVTGDIYYPEKEHQGYLKTWGLRMKVLVGVLLGLNAGLWCYALLHGFRLPFKLGR
jgi:hypothetical protein